MSNVVVVPAAVGESTASIASTTLGSPIDLRRQRILKHWLMLAVLAVDALAVGAPTRSR